MKRVLFLLAIVSALGCHSSNPVTPGEQLQGEARRYHYSSGNLSVYGVIGMVDSNGFIRIDTENMGFYGIDSLARSGPSRDTIYLALHSPFGEFSPDEEHLKLVLDTTNRVITEAHASHNFSNSLNVSPVDSGNVKLIGMPYKMTDTTLNVEIHSTDAFRYISHFATGRYHSPAPAWSLSFDSISGCADYGGIFITLSY